MKFVLPLCLTVALASFSRSDAQTGQRDASFGAQGVAVFDYHLASRAIQESKISLVLSDGRLLFATSSDRQLTLCKLDKTGVVDTSFGQDGVYATRDLPIWPEGGIQTAELADGKLVVGVNLYDGTGRYILTRLNADGTIDPSFGDNGRVIHPGKYHLTLADGRMIIVKPEGSVQLTRLLANGSIDTTFGTTGTRSLPYQGYYANSYQTPKSKLLGDGSVLLRLVTRSGQSLHQALIRLQADGTADALFGTGGAIVRSVAFVSLPSADDFVSLPSGDILARTGERQAERFSATGVLQGSSTPLLVDTIEGINSMGEVAVGIRGIDGFLNYHLLNPLTWSTSPLSWATDLNFTSALMPLPAGGYVLRSFTGFKTPYRLSKHHDDGSLDTTFGDQGRLTPEWHPAADCFRIRLQSNTTGNLSLLFDQGEDITSYSGVPRYTVTQTGVRAFAQLSTTGLPINTQLLHERSTNFAANLAPDGSCLIAGNGKVERLLGDGSRLRVDTVDRFPQANIQSVAENSDGHLLLGGSLDRKGYTEAAVFRFGPNRRVAALGLGRYEDGQVIDLLPNGMGGWLATSLRNPAVSGTRAFSDFHILNTFRLSRNFGGSGGLVGPRRGGTLAARPGANPIVNFQHSSGNWGKQPTPPSITTDPYSVSVPEFTGEIAVTADSDGSVVVAGATAEGYALRRINPHGQIDQAFGGQFDSLEGEADLISEIHRGPDGTWWVAGTTKDVAVHRLFVAKHTPDPIVATLLKPDSPLTLNQRTGLMEHEVLVTNHTKATVDVELHISGVMAGVRSVYLAPTVQLPAAEGTKGWKMIVPAVPAGGNKTVKIGYYLPSRRPLVFSPMIKVFSLTTPQ
jgi:uncharacterized delta-60 repeat protein